MSYSALPVLINNQSLVSMKQINNSASQTSGGINLDDTEFESYICHQLSMNVQPVNLENSDYSLPNSVSILDNSTVQTQTIINNNDNVLVNEMFAMKMNYTSSGTKISDSYNMSVTDSNKIPYTIATDVSNTVSIFDSNIKIDISLNCDTQYTGDNTWAVDFDRTANHMNYFACINSYLETVDQVPPFYVQDSSWNIYALGNETGIGRNNTTRMYFTRDASGILIPHDISATLQSNLCRSELNNAFNSSDANPGYNYGFDEFNSFNIVQDQPHVNASLVTIDPNTGAETATTGDMLPIQFDGVDISLSTFDFDGVFNAANPDLEKLGDGFKISVEMGIETEGGYTLVTDSATVSIDDSQLTRSFGNPYLAIDVENTRHYVEVFNGGVTAHSDVGTDNTNLIGINGAAETLTSDFNGTNGLIEMNVQPTDRRVYYPNGEGMNSTDFNNFGYSSDLTNGVDVYYNEVESGSADPSTMLSYGVKTTETAEYEVTVIASSTATFADTDARFLDANNDAILTMASTYAPAGVNSEDFTLTSSLVPNNTNIQIISLKNESILAQQSPLLDSNSTPVPNSSATVIMSNVDLSGSPYIDYKVQLVTKTIEDVSTILSLGNGWSVDAGTIAEVQGAGTQMIGTAQKTSVIYDDYLFMTNGNNLDISMNYTFEIANPICTSTQAVKHRIAISFYDLSDNTSYSTTQTTFYLDDQDISLNYTSTPAPVIDASCTDIVNSSLNNGSFHKADYRFEKYTKSVSYVAMFDSKFQFYTNLLFVTPEVTETCTYYKMYDALTGVEQPSYMLKYFKCATDGQLLSEVAVSLDQSYSVDFSLSQKVCSLFNVHLQGTTDGNSWVDVPNTDFVDLDPFFNLIAHIDNVMGGNTVLDVNVKISGTATVDQPVYTIELQTAPGQNVAFSAMYFNYDVTTGPTPVLDNYSVYNDFYSILQDNGAGYLVDVTLDVSGSTNIVTVRDGATVLAVINHPNNFFNNFNIILCEAPIMTVNVYYDYNLNNSFQVLAIDNTILVDSGVYYYNTPSPTVGMTDKFGLVSDAFKLLFVNDVAFPNNNAAFDHFITFDYNTMDSWLSCAPDVTNQTKSIIFEFIRGYTYAVDNTDVNGVATDVITLNRTVTQCKFWLQTITGPHLNLDISGTDAMQFFDNVYAGVSLNANAVVGQGQGLSTQTYDLGLLVNFNKSIFDDSELYVTLGIYDIAVSVCDCIVNVDDNPLFPELIGIVDEGDYKLTTLAADYLQRNLFSPYILQVRACCIKSYGRTKLTVTRSVPALKINGLTTPSYVGSPEVNGLSWTQLGTYPFNNFVWTGYTLSNLVVSRLSNEAMFYNDYSSYYVVAPPVVSVYGIPDNNNYNISSVPISLTTYAPTLFGSFDINNDSNQYIISDANICSTDLTFSQPSTLYYTDYLNDNSAVYSFLIEGNYVTISLFNAGVGDPKNSPTGPIPVDAASSPLDILYTGILNYIDNTDTFSVSIDSSLTYNIGYKQILPAVHGYNTVENIFFSVGNAFIDKIAGPYPSAYLRMNTAQGTSIAFFQANLIYNDLSGGSAVDPSGSNLGYYMIIDKYTTDTNVNYNSGILDTAREVFFPVQNHYVKQIPLSGIMDASGFLISQQDLMDSITLDEIANESWIQDTEFVPQYIGLTISSLSYAGRDAVKYLLKYTSSDFLQSKALYVRRQDPIRVVNVLGNAVFRVTNSGNVQTQRVTTSNVSLYYPAATPVGNPIFDGVNDIMSIYAQNTLIDNNLI